MWSLLRRSIFAKSPVRCLVYSAGFRSIGQPRPSAMKKLLEKPKRGGMILLGGGQGTATAPMNTSAVLLRQMNAKEIFDPVCCFATDHHYALEDEETMADLKKFAQFLNRK